GKTMPALQLAADDHLSRPLDAVDLKHRLGNVETDCRDRFHGWLPITATAPAAVTSMALTRRWGSRPQHHERTMNALLCSPPQSTSYSPCLSAVHRRYFRFARQNTVRPASRLT